MPPCPAAHTDFWTTNFPAVTGLIGVLVGGTIQMVTAFFLAQQQRIYRLKDDHAERQNADAKLAAERSYARALLARHLEGFARACADVMWENGDPENEFGAPATPLPDFGEWPQVSWELLGSTEMMRARDIALRVDLQKAFVSGSAYYVTSTPPEERSYFESAAARLGLEAWNLSKQMREEAGVEPFRFPPDGPNFADALARHVADEEERERKQEAAREARRAAREAAGEEPDPFD